MANDSPETGSPPTPAKRAGESWLRQFVRACKSVAKLFVPSGLRRRINYLIGRNQELPSIIRTNRPRLLVNGKLVSDSLTRLIQALLPPTPRYDVIVLPIIDWEFRFQRPQHLARQFARNGHRVFYARTNFGPPGSTAEVYPLDPLLANVQLPAPDGLNLYRDRADEATVTRWVEALEAMARQFQVSEAVCLVQLPFWRPLAFRLRERLGWKVVYDCMDKHSGFSTNDATMLDEETALSRGSDLVVVTARALEEDQRPLARDLELVPNACQFEHFSANFGPPPPALADLPRPLVGYYGAISDWFDTALLAEMARLRPQWSFPLIGNTFGADLTPLRGLPNVHLLGEQPYSTLPNYTHAFDACLIPFKITPLTEATNPVKFFEYLSAGKPVVSVALPELLPFVGDKVVSIADTAAGMVSAVEAELAGDSPEAVARRQAVARQNTWEARFARLSSAVGRQYPKVSVIILTYNNLNLNRLCVESIFRTTAWPDYELVIVDNASTDGTPEYLRQVERSHTNVRLVLNEKNAGFAGGNNQGLKVATGEYVVFLNNDTMVTRGWLGRLVRHLESDPKVGLVGPVTNSAGNEALIEVKYSTLEGMEEFAAERAHEYAGRSFEIAMPALFCAIARRSLFDEVGVLDEQYQVGLFEDDDLALRVRRAGYRNLCAQDVFIHHFQSESFKLLGNDAYQKIFDANRERFEKKWGVKWEPHQHRESA